MTARILALAAACALALAVIVAKVMAVSVAAGTLLACGLVGAAALYAAYRLIATGPGQRCAPRGFTADDERIALPCEQQIIPRKPTMHAAPWEPAPVIEPAAVTSGPPPGPAPDALFVATAVLSGGRVTEVRAAILPPVALRPAVHRGRELPPPVAAALGHATVDDALDSMFTRAMTRQVRALTDGAP